MSGRAKIMRKREYYQARYRNYLVRHFVFLFPLLRFIDLDFRLDQGKCKGKDFAPPGTSQDSTYSPPEAYNEALVLPGSAIACLLAFRVARRLRRTFAARMSA